MKWWREADPEARRALAAGMFGWMLDAFDVMIFALVLPSVRADLGLTSAQGGYLGSVMLVAAAVGGVGFGWFADRFGRTRALMLSVLLYSVFTFACGFATTLAQFVVFRIFLGLGMGGEWTAGAALVSETWPAQHRGKALGFMQSGWAIGYAAAVLVSGFVQPRYGWRAVFFIGILPALFTLWVRRRVKEPAIWTASSRSGTTSPGTAVDFQERHRRADDRPDADEHVHAVRVVGIQSLAAQLSEVEPGAGWRGPRQRPPRPRYLFIMQAGMWFGYVTFGFVSDRFGRKKTYVTYLLSAAVLLAIYVSVRDPAALLVLGPFVAFAATGYFSGFGAVTAEIYPTSVRATAQGFTYNIGRLASAAAPYLVGSLADTHGFGAALLVCSAAFVAAAVLWIWIPETKGRALA